MHANFASILACKPALPLRLQSEMIIVQCLATSDTRVHMTDEFCNANRSM